MLLGHLLGDNIIGFLTAEQIDHWPKSFRGQRETVSAADRGLLYLLYAVLSGVSLMVIEP